ncbi:hypothetical protein EVAR_103698_1 [Eumeta japonica]|uniref:Uncharacterized protein n=1 Tax=Eumeta variegata TaxID=151549 RepID=A0A4C1ZZ75_EUMVA|nr:hypothetical protein EVAR_103698_1 [Eumeta japonica]
MATTSQLVDLGGLIASYDGNPLTIYGFINDVERIMVISGGENPQNLARITSKITEKAREQLSVHPYDGTWNGVKHSSPKCEDHERPYNEVSQYRKHGKRPTDQYIKGRIVRELFNHELRHDNDVIYDYEGNAYRHICEPPTAGYTLRNHNGDSEEEYEENFYKEREKNDDK